MYRVRSSKAAIVAGLCVPCLAISLCLSPQVALAHERGTNSDIAHEESLVYDRSASASAFASNEKAGLKTEDALVENTGQDSGELPEGSAEALDTTASIDETPLPYETNSDVEEIPIADGRSLVTRTNDNAEFIADADVPTDAAITTAITEANDTKIDTDAVVSAKLADGLYSITVADNSSTALEVKNGSSANGASITIAAADAGSAAQLWQLKASSDPRYKGYYTIQNFATKQYLDVPGAVAKVGTKLWQYVANGTEAQLWRIISSPAHPFAYTLSPYLDNRLVLDIPANTRNSGTQIQLYTSNGTIAQSFSLNPVEQLIANGIYTVANVGTNNVLDVMAGSTANGAAVQMYVTNSTAAQRWHIQMVGNNVYTLQNLRSGKYLDVANGSTTAGAKVQQYTANRSMAQKWLVRPSENGSFVLSPLTNLNLALDIKNGSKASGAQVQTWVLNGTAAQNFSFTPLQQTTALKDGAVYTLSNQYSGRMLEVAAGSVKNGANIYQGKKDSPDISNYFALRYDKNSAYWELVSLQSFLSLDIAGARSADGANVQQYSSNGTCAQRWFIVPSGTAGTFRIASALDGRALSVAAGSMADGANVEMQAATGLASQLWNLTLIASSIDQTSKWLPSGLYQIHTKNNPNLVLGTQNASDGASIITLPSVSHNMRKYQLVWGTGENSSYVQLINLATAKALDIPNARAKSGALIQQYTANNTDAQWWEPRADFSGIRFVSKLDKNLVLDIYAGSTLSGARVQLYISNGTPAQRFVLASASPTEERYGLVGIDISNNQGAGFKISSVESDFVIIKATEGTTFIDPYWKSYASQAEGLGKKIGFYHFISANSSPSDQARFFYNQVKDYVGKALFVLDWEDTSTSHALSKGPSFAKQFLDEFYRLSGVKPLLYTSQSVTAAYDWSSVHNSGYQLWGAQYLYRYYIDEHGHDNRPRDHVRDPHISTNWGAWGKPLIYQYSVGFLPGWKEALDLDYFYGTPADWDLLTYKI